VKIDPRTGARTPFGGAFETPGLATGLAFDAQGHLYVAEATLSDDPAPGVFRIDAKGAPKRVVTFASGQLPERARVPRRHALHLGQRPRRGRRWDPGAASPKAPWIQDDLLLPGGGPDPKDIGANGIAFEGNDLLIAVSDAGRIVQVSLKHRGSPGKVKVLCEQPQLASADGIAVDDSGTIWIAVNHPTTGRLLALRPNGSLETIADQPTWSDYPTQPVLADGRGKNDTLYLSNGSLENGAPSVVALRIR